MVATVYDGSDNVLGAITAAINTGMDPVFSDSFAGFVSSVPIGYIVFSEFNGDGYDHIDDLQVAVTAVPLPPAVLLFGSGFLGLIGLARRENK